jgi:ATP/maltotriose-dependent transcriptional regulator MalT
MLGYHAYVKSRVIAMQGDTRKAIELCLTARRSISEDNLALHIDISITLGYEYFLYGDFENANQILLGMIRSSYPVGAVNNPVAAYAVLARMHIYQGQLSVAYDLLQKAGLLIREPARHYLGVTGLLDVEKAALLYEWNDLDAALDGVEHGLELLPMWGKADDTCLAYTTLARIQLAQGKRADAARAVESAAELIHTGGVFSEARNAVEAAQVRVWLAQEDWLAVDRWAIAHEARLNP